MSNLVYHTLNMGFNNISYTSQCSATYTIRDTKCGISIKISTRPFYTSYVLWGYLTISNEFYFKTITVTCGDDIKLNVEQHDLKGFDLTIEEITGSLKFLLKVFDINLIRLISITEFGA